MKQYEMSEILHHAGEHDLPFNAVSPPVFQTSIFCFQSFEEFQCALADEAHNYLYSRGNNPTVTVCEQKLALLEHAERAKLTASGVSAIALAVLAQVKAGDHCIAVAHAYDWSKYLFSRYLQRFGVSVSFVEGSGVEQFEREIRPETRCIYLESPASFTFGVQPLHDIADLARAHGIKTIMDNTWATPIFQNPIDFGIDIVVHSATKYLGGCSDLIGGVIMGSDKDITHIFNTEFLPLGPVPDPFQAWLIMRSLRSLHIRMPVHYANALALASFLESRDEVETVLYPLLPSFAQYGLAARQMRGGSGLFSFRLKTRDRNKIKGLTNRVRFFKRAVSWGGYESLIDPALVKFSDAEPVPDDRVSLIRIHAGLENSELLLSDLSQALDALHEGD